MKLTPKDLRAIELARKCARYDLVESLADYHHLVDTLLYLHEAITEEEIRVLSWQKDSEILFYKFAFHGLTLHNILSGLKLSSTYYKDETEGKSIIDISSARAVLRAKFEAFLMYHHIYVNPANNDVKELRYYAWIYSSLIQRQEFPATTEFAQNQKAKDQISLKNMRERISNLEAFKNLTSKQQKSLLESGNGKLFNHWVKILNETGFPEGSSFHTIYTILSMYAHSEGLSIIQLSHKPDLSNDIRIQANLDLHHSKQLVCLMIQSIVGLHEVVKKKYQSLPDNLRYDIELYCMMGKVSNRN